MVDPHMLFEWRIEMAKLLELGYSPWKAYREIASLYRVSPSTVFRYIGIRARDWKETDDVKRKSVQRKLRRSMSLSTHCPF
jgi:uncharacterized protein YjcR